MDNFSYNLTLPQPRGYVNGQRLEPTCGFRFGARDLAYCGCGIIAYKNALLLCGVDDITLAQAAFEMESAALLGGRLGVNMFLYGSRLRGHGLKVKKIRSRKKAESIPTGSVILLAYFLAGHIFRAHIVTAVRNDDGYTVYNHTGCNPEPTRFKSFREIFGGGRMIIAYEIKASDKA